MSPVARVLRLAAAAAMALCHARHARAECVPSGSRPALCRNDFSIDLYQGPVLAPSRVVALGGAYAALASGVDGLGQNTASAAVRLPYSFDQLDYDLTLSFYLPGAFGKTDFDNRGEVGFNSFTFFYSLGGQIQWGPLGIAALADFQRYTLAPQPDNDLPPSAIQIARLRVAAGSLIFRGQATLGVGLRGVRATVDAIESSGKLDQIFLPTSTNLLAMSGVAPEVGIVLHPDDEPWRLGLTYRHPVTASGNPDERITTGADGLRRVAGLALPHDVSWPWELEAGVALSVGPRPLNPRWINPASHEARARAALLERRAQRRRALADELATAEPELRELLRIELDARDRRETALEELRLRDLSRLLRDERKARYQNWPRARMLVAADVLVTGSSSRGVGLQSFLRQEDVESGDEVTFQPRLGIETEPLPDRLITRIGTYIEPSRYQLPRAAGILSGTRQHFTFGVELRVLRTGLLGLISPLDLTINIAGDLAPRYQNLGLSLGTWR